MRPIRRSSLTGVVAAGAAVAGHPARPAAWRLGFEGVVVTDALDMGAIDQADVASAALDAVVLGRGPPAGGPGQADRPGELAAIRRGLRSLPAALECGAARRRAAPRGSRRPRCRAWSASGARSTRRSRPSSPAAPSPWLRDRCRAAPAADRRGERAARGHAHARPTSRRPTPPRRSRSGWRMRSPAGAPVPGRWSRPSTPVRTRSRSVLDVVGDTTTVVLGTIDAVRHAGQQPAGPGAHQRGEACRSSSPCGCPPTRTPSRRWTPPCACWSIHDAVDAMPPPPCCAVSAAHRGGCRFGTPSGVPRMSLHDEIAEQPDRAAACSARGSEGVAAIAAALAGRRIDLVLIAARGSSDHAAIYAQYLFGAFHRLPVALAAPALTSVYGVEPRLERALVIGICQSGRSPDVVGVLEAARAPGGADGRHHQRCRLGPRCRGRARHRHRRGPRAGGRGDQDVLRRACSRWRCSPRHSRAATAVRVGDAAARRAALARLPGGDGGGAARRGGGQRRSPGSAPSSTSASCWGAASSTRPRGSGRSSSRSSRRWRPTRTPRPTSSTARWRSSSRATRSSRSRPRGATLAGMRELLARLRDQHGVDLLVISDDAETRALGSAALADAHRASRSGSAPSCRSCPAQLFAYHVTRARGLDTEQPRWISKVTLTH